MHEIHHMLHSYYYLYIHILDIIENLPESKRVDELVRLNVREQSLNLAKTNIVQQAWANGSDISIHGWVYDLHDGIIETVCEIDSQTDWDNPIYRFEMYF